MQEAFPAPEPAITLRKVTGGRHVWIAEADIDYGGDQTQAVIIFELDDQGLIAYSWREKICRKNRKTFRMSRKIDAASRGAELTSRDSRIRWKSNMV